MHDHMAVMHPGQHPHMMPQQYQGKVPHYPANPSYYPANAHQHTGNTTNSINNGVYPPSAMPFDHPQVGARFMHNQAAYQNQMSQGYPVASGPNTSRPMTSPAIEMPPIATGQLIMPPYSSK